MIDEPTGPLGYKLTDIDPNALVPVPDEIDSTDYNETHQPLDYTMPDFEERAMAAGLGDYRRSQDKGPLSSRAHDIPLEVMKKMDIPLDIWAKARHGTCIMSDWGDEMEKSADVNWWLAYKLSNVLWRWGYKVDWNTQARAMQSLPKFTLPIFDEIRLDTSTHFNPRSHAKFHRDIFIDGPLAYMCYLKGKHVMTISFAISSGGKLLITQIQPVGKGNRWLFKFDRKKEVLKAFRRAFKDFKIYLACGESMVHYLRAQKVNSLNHAAEWAVKYEKWGETSSAERHRKAMSEATKTIEHFDEVAKPRILSFYAPGRGSVGFQGLRFKAA